MANLFPLSPIRPFPSQSRKQFPLLPQGLLRALKPIGLLIVAYLQSIDPLPKILSPTLAFLFGPSAMSTRPAPKVEAGAGVGRAIGPVTGRIRVIRGVGVGVGAVVRGGVVLVKVLRVRTTPNLFTRASFSVWFIFAGLMVHLEGTIIAISRLIVASRVTIAECISP